jgi:hypothetical protein
MKVLSSISCQAALELMSPFIDSMVAAEEAQYLRSHVSECVSCRRQLQSFVSLRNVISCAEPVSVPEDLQLDTRVRLSHVRRDNTRERLQTRFNNFLRPVAMPAVMGIALTLVGFCVLLGSLTSPRSVIAEDGRMSTVTVYQPPKTTDPTLRRLGASVSTDLETLSVQTEVNNAGRIDDFSIIAGTRSADVDQWLQELVLLSQFRPATFWGMPVRSRVIFSFVTVRG